VSGFSAPPGVANALADPFALALGDRGQDGEHHLRHAVGDDAAAEVDQMQVDGLILGVRSPAKICQCRHSRRRARVLSQRIGVSQPRESFG
jgi:hypothetical protein